MCYTTPTPQWNLPVQALPWQQYSQHKQCPFKFRNIFWGKTSRIFCPHYMRHYLRSCPPIDTSTAKIGINQIWSAVAFGVVSRPEVLFSDCSRQYGDGIVTNLGNEWRPRHDKHRMCVAGASMPSLIWDESLPIIVTRFAWNAEWLLAVSMHMEEEWVFTTSRNACKWPFRRHIASMLTPMLAISYIHCAAQDPRICPALLIRWNWISKTLIPLPSGSA